MIIVRHARGHADRRRDNVERDPLFAIIARIAARAIALGPFTGRTYGTILARCPFRPVFANDTFGTVFARSMLRTCVALCALGTILAWRTFRAFVVRRSLGPLVVARAALLLLWLLVIRLLRHAIVVASLHHVVVVAVAVILVARLAALFVIARAAFAQHAIIMVGELQIIFGLDPIAGELRIARHALVFLMQLGGIAALAIILAISVRPTGDPRRLSSTTAAAVIALTIVDQIQDPHVPATRNAK